MAEINATTPVVAPASASIVYDKWMVVKMLSSTNATRSPLNITIQRAAKTAAGWVLMPNDKDNAQVNMNLDVFKEGADTPEIATAIEAITAAVIAYGTKKKLI